MKIYEILEREIDKELDKMPKGLSTRNKRRYVNKALDKIAKSIGREFGIQNPSSKGIKDVFWNCQYTFPDFDDDGYIQTLKGEPFEKPVRFAEYKYLESYNEEDRRNFSNQLIVNNEWGANYDPETKTMLGGYSEDGHQFRPDFRIKELEEDDMPNALAVCSLLYPKYGKIDTSYSELQKEFGKSIQNNEVKISKR